MSGNRISLAQAQMVISAAIEKGRALDLKPICIAVLDPGGHLVALAREDGASNLRPQIAAGKASGALALGISSRQIAEMATDRPTFVAAIAGLNPAGIVPAAGGLLIRDAEGVVIGALGVTGDTSDNDELCADAGASAIKL